MTAGRILATTVTFNRLGLLKRSIESLRNQTRRPDEILVVDNSSSDGTREWLESQPDLKLIRQPNSGSAGGFNSATRYAYDNGFDWVWMMDDDTIPRQDALERLLACPATSRETTGFVYSLQVYPDGSVPRHDPGPTGADEWALTVLSERCVPVEKCSFVAIMVSRRALERVGYPIREMFFMVDDYEFTRRIVGAGLKGYCVLDSVVLHDTQIPVVYDVRSWSPVKKRYSVRNHVFYYRTAPESLRKRAWRISRLLAVEVIGLASGASNMSVVLWALKGLFFNPKPEMPAPVNRQGGDRQGLAV